MEANTHSENLSGHSLSLLLLLLVIRCILVKGSRVLVFIEAGLYTKELLVRVKLVPGLLPGGGAWAKSEFVRVACVRRGRGLGGGFRGGGLPGLQLALPPRETLLTDVCVGLER